MKNWLFAMLLLSAPLRAGEEKKPPIASNPVVEVRGAILRVQLAAAEGMPFLEVSTAKGPVKLLLGSMRYLVQENFTPKAGELVEASGYKVSDDVVAIRVELPANGKVLKLRDEHGWPLWRGGPRGRGGGPR